MPYPIEQKLVVAVSSTALFDLREADAVFRTEGLDAFLEYQEENRAKPSISWSCFSIHSAVALGSTRSMLTKNRLKL